MLCPCPLPCQLKRCFNLHPSPAEFGALLSYFDKEKRGRVDGVEFLVAFFRTGQGLSFYSHKGGHKWMQDADNEWHKEKGAGRGAGGISIFYENHVC